MRLIIAPYRSPDSGGDLPINEPADIVVVNSENDFDLGHLGEIPPPIAPVWASGLPTTGEVVKDNSGLVRDPAICDAMKSE